MEIKLTNGTVTIVDKSDYHHLSQHVWWLKACKGLNYAYRKDYVDGVRVDVAMHRVIAKPGDQMVIDHINRNGLDNRRANLRVCTQGENLFNKGSYKNSGCAWKGVSYHVINGKYIAQIQANKKQRYLGSFSNACDAAMAYNNAAYELHGEFAYYNVSSLN